jgi:hypothetical protein
MYQLSRQVNLLPSWYQLSVQVNLLCFKKLD